MLTIIIALTVVDWPQLPLVQLSLCLVALVSPTLSLWQLSPDSHTDAPECVGGGGATYNNTV